MLDGLSDLAFHAVLLAAWLGGAVLLLPGLGGQDVPASIRLALVLAVVARAGAGAPPLRPELPELLRLVLTETAVGLWLGMLARLVALALGQAGQIVGLMVGLASPLQTDPVLGAQSVATGRLFTLFAAVLVLSTGLYAPPLRALAESYGALPAGAPVPLGRGAESVAQAVAALFAFGGIALLDLFWVRWRHRRRMRMSREELRQEYRESERDPQIKARLRQIREQRARRRILPVGPKATTTVTNLTHYAIVRFYAPGQVSAPELVAKGVDAMAARTRAAATKHGVPIIENPPLRRMAGPGFGPGRPAAV